jgi:hypothetical protein
MEGRATITVNRTTTVLETKDMFAVPKNTQGVLIPLAPVRLIFQTATPTASDVAACEATLKFTQTAHAFGAGRTQYTVTLTVGADPLYNVQLELTSSKKIEAVLLFDKVFFFFFFFFLSENDSFVFIK